MDFEVSPQVRLKWTVATGLEETPATLSVLSGFPQSFSRQARQSAACQETSHESVQFADRQFSHRVLLVWRLELECEEVSRLGCFSGSQFIRGKQGASAAFSISPVRFDDRLDPRTRWR
jgi:hypothetical protein